MNHSHPFGALAALALGACIPTAEAQTRRAPRRPPVAASRDAGAPADAGVAGPRDTRYVVNRGAGAWQPRCVASVGCEAPREIPRCDPSVRARPFGEVGDDRVALNGQRVVVRGRVQAGAGCTEMACPDGACCNHCTGAMSLHGAGQTSFRTMALGADGDAAFACRGDDSGVCCGTALPAGDAVVTGVLRLVPGSGGRWRLESPTLCLP